MKILNRRLLLDFWAQHPDSRLPLQTWFHLTRSASWSSPEQLRADYPAASFITRDWVSLPLKPALCTLVVQVVLEHKLVILRHITRQAPGMPRGRG